MPARPGAGTEGSTVLPAGPTQLPPSGLGDSLPATRETPVDDAVNGQEHPQPLFEVDEMVAGHFRVLGQLGRGGMAQVWEAKDLELDRRVALKAARPRPPVPPLRKEARALAAFQHPSLVTVYGLGHHEGIDFIVMERIFGVSLAERLEERRSRGRQLELSAALEVLTAIAAGLAVVHRSGLAHRDVKPENVMLTPDGRVVLMDFGLVLPEYDSTLRGFVAGSPPYMAPETLADRVGMGGGQLVDVYALGATAFEMLTGRAPFVAPSLNELFVMHMEAPAPSVRDLRADCPPALDELVGEMLEKDPARRPQSAQGIAWQLRGIAARLDTPRRAASQPPPAPDTGILDVLVVEDDDALARVEAFYLEQLFGRERLLLRRARDGEEAVAAVRQRAPDLLLLDLHLPKLNGIEVGMQIRGDGLAPDTKFVAVSAGAQESDLQLLHLLGFHHFVPKGEGMQERLAEVLIPLFPELSSRG
ncbi:MAG: hypothetical protein CMN30_20340 [Sandaracinus sp.]|nr:hypothetical protein [Sandaracinus sp.]